MSSVGETQLGEDTQHWNSHAATVTFLPRSPTVSSTATESNRPGPGRGLDNLFQFLGRRLENSVNRLALRLGYGPDAAVRMLCKSVEMLAKPEKRVYRKKLGRWTQDEWTARELATAQRNVDKACRRLVKYLQTSPPATQSRILAIFAELKMTHLGLVDNAYTEYDLWPTILAIHSYLELATMNPAAAPALWHAVYNRQYHPGELDNLLSTSRKALYCVENNELNRLAKSVSELRVTANKMGYYRAEDFGEEYIMPRLEEMLQYLLHPELAFLSLRYLNKFFSSLYISLNVMAEAYLKLSLLMKNSMSERCCRQDHSKVARIYLLIVYDESWIEEKSTSVYTSQATLQQNMALAEHKILKQLIHDFEIGLRRLVCRHFAAPRHSPSPTRLMDERFDQICRDKRDSLNGREARTLLKLCQEIDDSLFNHLRCSNWYEVCRDRKKSRELRLLHRR